MALKRVWLATAAAAALAVGLGLSLWHTRAEPRSQIDQIVVGRN